MTSTDSYSQDDRDPIAPAGYTRRLTRDLSRDTGPWVPNASAQPWRGCRLPALRPRDLARYIHAFEAGKILAPATAEQFYGARRNPDGSIGLGLGIAGGSPGVNAVLENGGGWTLIVLSNLDPPSAESLAQRARGWTKRVKE
jgi:hypothetical protein